MKLKYLSVISLLVFIIFYLFTHLFSLVLLPVFADESIYIRWTQLIIDDWKQYLFFPLNDGKTPLHMWLMIPFQFIFSDQLYAGRFLSVLVGLPQAFILAMITKELGGRKKAQFLTLILVSILPFWFFHHRMALIDGLLTFLFSISVLFSILAIKKFDQKSNKRAIIHFIIAGLFFGLSLLTKLPSVLFAPIYYVLIFLSKNDNYQNYLKLALYSSISIIFGLFIFFTLKLHPAFGQLFSRGGDFLFSIGDILSGEWRQSLKNVPTFFNYFIAYLTLPILILSFMGLFFDKIRKKQAVLMLSALAFLLPIIILGRIVYPRYLMPVSIFFTLGGVLALQELIDKYVYLEKKLIVKVITTLVVIQFVSSIFISSANFMFRAQLNPNTIPFAKIDKHQYLYDWSSGHGILDTVNLIKKESQDQRILVLTEGYFGTLPDAILMYFHRQNVNNIFIQGIGQPVGSIPQEMIDKSIEFDSVWLVVNSHRLKIDLPQEKLVAEFCRPDNFPCLQVWEINDFIKSKIETSEKN